MLKNVATRKKTIHKDIFNSCFIMKSEKECSKIDFFGRKNDKHINNFEKVSVEDCQSKK